MAHWKLAGAAALVLVLDPGARAGAPVEESPQARETIDAAIEAYRSLTSYQCTHERSWTIKLQDGSASEDKGSVHVRFLAPDRFSIASERYDIRCDGTTLVVQAPQWDQYIRGPVGDIATLDARLREMTGGSEGLPLVIEARMRPEAALGELWSGVLGFTEVAEGVSAGRDCWWVTAVIEDTAYSSGLNVEQRLSIDQETRMIVRSVADFAMPARAITPQIESAVYSTTNRDIVLNKPIDAGAFVFAPGAEDRQVKAFELPAAESEPAPVVDAAKEEPAAAPAFEESDLEGKRVTLADFKGRVLVLDFWATWCGPCIAAMPAMQALSQEFKGKPVDVVGVNVDQPGMGEKIRKVLLDKGVTMRQIIDADSSMSRAYGAQAIPLVVVIDQNGIVRHRHVGYSPRGDEAIAREIEALLKETGAP